MAFDNAVQRCFGPLSGIHPDDVQWLQGTLATKAIGLGCESAKPITAPRNGPEHGVAMRVVSTPEKNDPE